jgi:hypothetical protein
MFLSLLIIMFAVALATAAVVARLFDRPVAAILARLVTDEFATAWHRYIKFAIFVVGISGGVRIWTLEQYLNPRGKDEPPLALTAQRWTLEIYRTIIETLQSTAWLLLAFFLVALIAYVIVRGQELKHGRTAEASNE